MTWLLQGQPAEITRIIRYITYSANRPRKRVNPRVELRSQAMLTTAAQMNVLRHPSGHPMRSEIIEFPDEFDMTHVVNAFMSIWAISKRRSASIDHAQLYHMNGSGHTVAVTSHAGYKHVVDWISDPHYAQSSRDPHILNPAPEQVIVDFGSSNLSIVNMSIVAMGYGGGFVKIDPKMVDHFTFQEKQNEFKKGFRQKPGGHYPNRTKSAGKDPRQRDGQFTRR